MKRFGARGDHFREVPNWGRSVLVLVCLFLFLCSEKPEEKVMQKALVQSLNIVLLYNLAVNDSSLCLNLPCHSIHPSLIHTNHHQSTRAHNQQKRSPLTHTLTQVCNCNQAHSSVFTTEYFSSNIWGSQKGLAIKTGVFLRENSTAYQLGSLTLRGPDGHLVWLVLSQQPLPLYPICSELFPGISAGLLYFAFPLHELLAVLASLTPREQVNKLGVLLQNATREKPCHWCLSIHMI